LPGKKRENRGSPSGRLRIVAGKWRSRLLPVADVAGLRPTSERIRETLFNWLTPVIDGARCLDLFAGTGALGFEAVSRGAFSADLVESSSAAGDTLRENSRVLAATEISIHQMDAFEFLRRRSSQQPFDIVFLDPPFADGNYEELCRLLADKDWLAPGALVYLEQARKNDLPVLPDGWQVKKEKAAGNVRFSLIETATEGSRQ